MLSHISCINFYIRSNVGVMAGNRDTVNQSESYNCIIIIIIVIIVIICPYMRPVT